MVVGCGGSKDNVAKPEPTPASTAAPESKEPIDVAIRGLTEWKTTMCACTDAACADKAHEGYEDWEQNTIAPMFKDAKIEELPKDKVELAEKLDDERKACRRKLKGEGGASIAEAMAKMAEFRDKMCACKDADCAKKVSDEMTQWSQEEASKATRERPMMTEDDQKKAIEIGTQMGECMQRAMGMQP